MRAFAYLTATLAVLSAASGYELTSSVQAAISAAPASTTAAASLHSTLSPLGLTSLKALVDRAPRIKSVFASSGADVTLFAPTNVALDRVYGAMAKQYKLPKGEVLKRILASPVLLEGLLSQWVYSAPLTSEAIAMSYNKKAVQTWVKGVYLVPIVDSTTFRVMQGATTAKVFQRNKKADGSVIHVVGTVLMSKTIAGDLNQVLTSAKPKPSTKPTPKPTPKPKPAVATKPGLRPGGNTPSPGAGSLYDALGSLRLTTLRAAVDRCSLKKDFKSRGLDATLFAPTDKAFDTFFGELARKYRLSKTVVTLKVDVGWDRFYRVMGAASTLDGLVSEHVYPKPLTSTQIQKSYNLRKLETWVYGVYVVSLVQGGVFSVSEDDSVALVGKANQWADGSIIHVINQVLVSKDMADELDSLLAP